MPITTEAARTVIGDQSPDDWKLRPETHSASLSPEAGTLKRVLEKNEIKETVERFREADLRAQKAQGVYRRVGRLGIWARFIALFVGSIALLPLGEWGRIVFQPPAIVVQGTALLINYLTALWLSQRGPFSDWMHARGAAEIARVELFEKVLVAQEETLSGEIPLLPLKLEYFRRYQLEVQIAFYGGRGTEHAQAAGRTLRWKAFNLAFILLAAVGILYVLGAIGGNRPWGDEETQRAVIAFMTLVSAVLATFSDISLMDLDERNASRYVTSHANLVRLRDEFLERVRVAAAEGDESAVLAFAKLVQDQVSSEHREWVLIRDLAPRPEIELLLRLPVIGGRVIAGAGTHKPS